MERTAKAFWIWSEFTQSDTDYLTKISRKVKYHLKTPDFRLHLTLAGPFKNIQESERNLIEDLCNKTRPIKVRPNKYEFKKKYYESFFISIKNSTELANLRQEIFRIKKFNTIQNFYPHISLAYGNHQEKLKNDLSGSLPSLISNINIDKICIVNVNEEIELWKVSDKITLKGNSLN